MLEKHIEDMSAEELFKEISDISFDIHSRCREIVDLPEFERNQLFSYNAIEYRWLGMLHKRYEEKCKEIPNLEYGQGERDLREDGLNSCATKPYGSAK